MTVVGPSFDLGALANHLVAQDKHRKLAGCIQKVIASHSLKSDLDIARETLDALDALLLQPTPIGDTVMRSAEAGLLCTAIVLYARATKTTSNTRRSFDPRDRFTDEEKVVHHEICDLRDHAVAHFGDGGSYQGEWQSETAIMQCVDGIWKIGTATRRLTVDKPLMARLRLQIDAAYRIIDAEHRARNEAAAVALNEARVEDPLLDGLIAEFPLDLVKFFKAHEAAAAAVSGFHADQTIKGGSSH